MTQRERLECDEQKRDMIARHPYCQVCHVAPSIQLAHVIPKSKANLRKYGKAVIHHRRNLRAVCGLRCNSAVLLGCRPLEEAELVARIQADLHGWQDWAEVEA